MNYWVRPEGMSDAEYSKTLAVYAEAMSMMLRTDGWKMYDQYMAGEEAAILLSVKDAKTGDEALKAAGALRVIQAMRAWPHDLLSGTATLLRGDAK